MPKAVVPWFSLLFCLVLVSCSGSGSGRPSPEPEPDPPPSPPVMSEISDATNSLQLGDVNGDGRLDLVVGNETAEILLYLNEGGVAPFENMPPIRLTQPQHGGTVHLADFDGDQRPDLMFGQYGGPLEDVPLLLFRNQGQSPWFEDSEPLLGPLDGPGLLELASGDVDEDGDLDLVSAHGYGTGGILNAHDLVLLHLNTGNIPVFAGQRGQQVHAESTFINPDIRASAIRDFTGDGALDVLVARGNGGGIDPSGCLLLRGNGTGGFPVRRYLFTDPGNYAAMAVDDLDGDGDADVVLGAHGSSELPGARVFAFLNQGDGESWTAHQILDLDQGINCLALADFNGDDLLDLFVGIEGVSRILFGVQGGAPFQDAPNILVGEADDALQTVAVGDVDGDLAPDLILGRWQAPNRVVRNATLRPLFPQ